MKNLILKRKLSKNDKKRLHLYVQGLKKILTIYLVIDHSSPCTIKFSMDRNYIKLHA